MARGHSPTLRDAWTVSYICSTLDGWARPVLNLDQPPSIPQRPMGSIPVVIRLVRPDGEEWWPGTANRWTDTHVLVH